MFSEFIIIKSFFWQTSFRSLTCISLTFSNNTITSSRSCAFWTCIMAINTFSISFCISFSFLEHFIWTIISPFTWATFNTNILMNDFWWFTKSTSDWNSGWNLLFYEIVIWIWGIPDIIFKITNFTIGWQNRFQTFKAKT